MESGPRFPDITRINSPSLVMSSFTSNTTKVNYPRQPDVREGDDLRVWYGEDLADLSESDFNENDNGGEVCCDVFTLIIV